MQYIYPAAKSAKTIGMDINEIRLLNLKALLSKKKARGKKQSECATDWNMSNGYLSQVLSEKIKKQLGPVVARRIEHAEGLGRGWFDSIHDESLSTPIIADDVSNDEYAFIPVLSIKAAAGEGHENVEEVSEGTLAFKREWMMRRGLKEENLRLIRSCGDSMYPNIAEGDMLLVDTSRIEPHSGKIYAIRRPDYTLSVKRLTQGFTGDWTIVSDNPDKAKYRDEPVGDISAANIPIIGQVVWRGGMM